MRVIRKIKVCIAQKYTLALFRVGMMVNTQYLCESKRRDKERKSEDMRERERKTILKTADIYIVIKHD